MTENIYDESAAERLSRRETLVTLLAKEADSSQGPYHYAMIVMALASAAWERAEQPRVQPKYGTIGELAKALLSAASEVTAAAEELEQAVNPDEG